jgi:hypothetical protein
MAKWTALTPLSMPSTPSTLGRTIWPGESVELSDAVAIILLKKGCIRPATAIVDRGNSTRQVKLIELKEHEHDTDNQ